MSEERKERIQGRLKYARIDLLVGTTHPRLMETLIDLLDVDPDIREKICRAYTYEWPERAKKFFE